MLLEWLSASDRNPNPFSGFRVIDIVEGSACSDVVREHLSQLIQVELFDTDFLVELAEHLGWTTVRTVLMNRNPSRSSFRRGDFGEILTNATLEQLFGYKIPVRKLRYKVVANQTMPGTDSLAIRVGDLGKVREVCFVESKLRTTVDQHVALTAYEQLRRDYDLEVPSILTFVAQRLFETNHELYEPFMEYLGDRADTQERETFCISLSMDIAVWDEMVLQNLEDGGVELSSLSVYPIRLEGLSGLIDSLTAAVGLRIEDGE